MKKLLLIVALAFAVTACGKKETPGSYTHAQGSASYAPDPQPQIQNLKATDFTANGRSVTVFCWSGLQFITAWNSGTTITQVLDTTGKPMTC